MHRLLCIGIALVTYLTLCHSVTIEYTHCPKGCKCEEISVASLVRCNDLLPENERLHIPVTHYEIRDAIKPITITNGIFAKMGLIHVNSIVIRNSTIITIEKDAFKGLSELTYLKIAHSNITHLHPDTFENNKNLRKISLKGNPLNISSLILPDSVEEINISYCNITKLTPMMFANLSQLTYLDLSGNNIEILTPGSFDPLIDIEEINLSHNKLKEIPRNIFDKNDDLDLLDLSYNPLTTFYFNDQFSSLETLKLKSCLLTRIDRNMLENVQDLFELDLSNNSISEIDQQAFAKLNKLSSIDLSGNHLQSIDENIFIRNSLLEHINLDHNNLTALPANGFKSETGSFHVYHFSCNFCNLNSVAKDTFKYMPALVDLSLSHNKISDISTGVFQTLNSINLLDLSFNEINTIDDNTFKDNPNINRLSLSNNPLKALHASMFAENSNLKYIDLSNCGLYKLWTGPHSNLKLSSILSLNVSLNKLSVIEPEDIAVTDNLKTLDLSINPIACTESLKEVVKYLQDHDIRNSQYIMNEQQTVDFTKNQNEEFSWISLARTNCPKLYENEERKEVEDQQEDEEDEDSDDDLNYTDFGDNIDNNNDDQSQMINDVDNHILLLPSQRHHYYRYSYMWPILVFIGTVLAVLGIVANAILFVIRRRQSIVIPRIVNIRSMSKLKKNSGLVYQQLSEEHGPKTPILSRFTAIPAVHTINTLSNGEHV